MFRIIKFLHRSRFFELKRFEIFSNEHLMNYQDKSNSYFWQIVERRGVSKVFDIFWKSHKIRTLYHLNRFEFASLGESSFSLGRLSCTSPTINKRERPWNLGLTSFLGIIPHLLQLNFYLPSLAYLIHVFRISELLCKAIKLRIEYEPRVRFWVLYDATVIETHS